MGNLCQLFMLGSVRNAQFFLKFAVNFLCAQVRRRRNNMSWTLVKQLDNIFPKSVSRARTPTDSKALLRAISSETIDFALTTVLRHVFAISKTIEFASSASLAQ